MSRASKLHQQLVAEGKLLPRDEQQPMPDQFREEFEAWLDTLEPDHGDEHEHQ